MNRIILEPGELEPDGHAVLHGRRAKHIVSVLRAAKGKVLRVGIVDGPCGEAEVIAMDETAIRLKCTLFPHTPPCPPVSLLLALPRPKVMRRLWMRLASAGVNGIILTNAERVERNYFDTHWLTPETYRPLLLEGLEQSGDTRLPSVHVRKRLKVFLEDELDALLPAHDRLVADPGSRSLLGAGLSTGPRRVLLAVGPEGGWTAYEREMLANHNFRCVSIGKRILRSDDACVTLLSVLNMMLEEDVPSGKFERSRR